MSPFCELKREELPRFSADWESNGRVCINHDTPTELGNVNMWISFCEKLRNK